MPRPVRPTATPAPVTTMLTPAERLRVDAAGAGLYRTLHRDSVDDVLRDLRERRAAAVLVSVARCVSPVAGLDTTRVAMVVREFPRVPAVALLSPSESSATAGPAGQAALASAMLSLGRCGVGRLVDVRQPGGWHELREVLGREGDNFERYVLETVVRDLAGAPLDCHRFFQLLFHTTSGLSTVRTLARQLGVVPSTLMSRFFRAHLPAPLVFAGRPA